MEFKKGDRVINSDGEKLTVLKDTTDMKETSLQGIIFKWVLVQNEHGQNSVWPSSRLKVIS